MSPILSETDCHIITSYSPAHAGVQHVAENEVK